MKIVLNVWQRVMLGLAVGSAKGNVAVIRKAMKAMDILELSDVEKNEVGYISLPNGDVQWANSDKVYELEFKDKEVPALIKRMFGQYTGWNASDGERIMKLAAVLDLDEPAE